MSGFSLRLEKACEVASVNQRMLAREAERKDIDCTVYPRIRFLPIGGWVAYQLEGGREVVSFAPSGEFAESINSGFSDLVSGSS